jgi:hypothetical protein
MHRRAPYAGLDTRTWRPLLNPVPLKQRLPFAGFLYDVNQQSICPPKDKDPGNEYITAIGFNWPCKAC